MISGVPLDGNVPLEKSTGGSAVLPVIQISMADIPFYSLLKLDLLGLKTCTILKYAMDASNLDWEWYDSEDYEDEEVYNMLSKGLTSDVFQFSSNTPTRLIKDFKVKDILGLFAVNSCNRPGPLQTIKSLGKSMVQMYKEGADGNPTLHGIDCVDEYLKDTYGCIIFQEQCMIIGQMLAGYTLGSADARIRKILAKKKEKEIPGLETEFLYGKKPLIKQIEIDSVLTDVVVFRNSKGDELLNLNYNANYANGYRPVPSDKDSPYNNIGCVNNGYKDDINKCIAIFDIIKAMATYCFNLSHAGSYATIGYKTAYLSCHYPLEYTYGCLKVYTDSEKKIKCAANAKKRGVKFLAPDINSSKEKISILKENGKNKALIYGIADIDGVGEKTAKVIVEEREQNGEYKDLYDFLDRTVYNKTDVVINIAGLNKKGKPNSPIDKRVVNTLIKAGAFDSIEENRFKLLNVYNTQINVDKNWKLYDENNYIRAFKLQLELEALKFYVSEHPLEPFPYVDFNLVDDNSFVIFTGVVLNKYTKTTKNNKKYYDVVVETKDSTNMTVRFWDKEYKTYKSLIKKNEILIFHGTYSQAFHNVSCKRVQTLNPEQETKITDDLSNIKSPIDQTLAPSFDMFSAFDDI